MEQFDQIVYLRRGIILESGPYSKLMADNEGELNKLMQVPLPFQFGPRLTIQEVVDTGAAAHPVQLLRFSSTRALPLLSTVS